jgi:glycosyltransferase involved in cell wall biosynthesis
MQQLILSSDPARFRHVVIALGEDGPIAQDLRAAGIEVRALGLKRGVPSPFALLQLISWLRHLKPDVLHCRLYHACLAGALSARLAGVPRMIWGLHSANDGLRDYSFLTRCVVRTCARLSFLPDAIVAVSQKCRTVHEHLGFSTARMRVIANGVDVRRFQPDASARNAVRTELGLPLDSILVGLVARFSPMKDHETFLRATSLVSRRNPQVRFVLAGRGVDADNKRLIGLISQNQVQELVLLLGERRDVPRLTAAMDIACLSSWSESFGNVIVEAMACSVPCVATDVGDLASIIENTGRVVPPSNPQALAEAIASLVNLPAADRARLGSLARERVLAKFALPATVSAYESVYLELGGSLTQNRSATKSVAIL